MKKCLSVLLALVMLCSVTVSAMAENGFMSVLYLLMSENMLGEQAYTLEPQEESDGKAVAVYFIASEDNSIGRVLLFGHDANGQDQAILWQDGVTGAKMNSVLYSLSKNYAQVQSVCDEGVTLALCYMSDGDPDSLIVIANAEEADTFCKLMEELAAQ